MSGADGTRRDGVQRIGDTNRAIFWAVIGTGVGLATLALTLAGLFNARIDDVNTSLNARIDDVNASMNARIDDVNARIDDVNARIDDLQDDIRELRGLVIQALNESPSAD